MKMFFFFKIKTLSLVLLRLEFCKGLWPTLALFEISFERVVFKATHNTCRAEESKERKRFCNVHFIFAFGS